MDVISRLDTVKMPPAPMGFKKLAKKAHAQQDQLGCAIAISTEASTHRMVVAMTIQYELMRCTTSPTTTFVRAPEMGAGGEGGNGLSDDV